MSLIYIPRQTNPFMQMLPSFLSNMTMQGIAHKRQQQATEQAQQAAQQRRLEDLQVKGWREASGPSATAVSIGGTLMEPPEIGYEEQETTIGGRKYPIFAKTVTPYGGKAQVTDFKFIDPKNPPKRDKIWIHNPNERRKMQIYPEHWEVYSQAGWKKGSPYGPQGTGLEIYGYDEKGRPLFRMGGKETSLDKIKNRVLGKQIETYVGLESATEGMVAQTGKILGDLKQDSSLIGTVGGLTRFIESAGSQIESLVDKVLPKADIKVNLDPNAYNWKSLSGPAVKSAKIKARVLGLAYSVARLREPDARQFSEADIQNAIDTVGGATGSADQMTGVMQSVMEDAVGALDRKSRQIYGPNKPYLPQGLSEETIEYGISKHGLTREQVIIRHLMR